MVDWWENRVECRLRIGECCAFVKLSLNISGPRTVLCDTPVVMVFTTDTPLFTRTTFARSYR